MKGRCVFCESKLLSKGTVQTHTWQVRSRQCLVHTPTAGYQERCYGRVHSYRPHTCYRQRRSPAPGEQKLDRTGACRSSSQSPGKGCCLPRSESERSEEIVDPMLSIRIRSVSWGPCSCSSRRFRNLCSRSRFSSWCWLFLSASSSF